MARIIYGVAGEGKGHYTRSSPIIKELQKKHKVTVLAGSSAFKKLNQFNIQKISSFNIFYVNNKVSIIGTILRNLLYLPVHLFYLVKTLFLFATFKPDLVITDFEPISAYASLLFFKPLLSIDNVHALSRTQISYPKKYCFQKNLADFVVHISIPRADKYLITSFFFPPVKKKNTKLISHVLRDEIALIKPKYNDYILVYQTSKSDRNIIEELSKVNEKFIVYGVNENRKINNMEFKKFNETSFFNDLSNCKAVITNGGYSLISEAIYLKKPIMSVPVGTQFEQILNSIYVQKQGYGVFSDKWRSKEIKRFVSSLNKYRNNLKKLKLPKFNIKDVELEIKVLIK